MANIDLRLPSKDFRLIPQLASHHIVQHGEDIVDVQIHTLGTAKINSGTLLTLVTTVNKIESKPSGVVLSERTKDSVTTEASRPTAVDLHVVAERGGDWAVNSIPSEAEVLECSDTTV